MGIKDATVLAELLTHATATHDLPHLMKCYHQARHARVDKVRDYSAFVGKMFSYPDGTKQRHRDRVLRSCDPNLYLDTVASMNMYYGSAEWMRWLDCFDVGETVSIFHIHVYQQDYLLSWLGLVV